MLPGPSCLENRRIRYSILAKGMATSPDSNFIPRSGTGSRGMDELLNTNIASTTASEKMIRI
jgi:hypothetical protein